MRASIIRTPTAVSNPLTSNKLDLRQPFLKHANANKAPLIGIELEFFPVYTDTFRIIPFAGTAGIEELLRSLAEKFAWTAVYEGPHIIALSRSGENVTLEPGGAIEYDSPPTARLDELETNIKRFTAELLTICSSRNVSLLTTGRLPYDTVQSVKLLPKARYEFMYPYMAQVGARGQEMMKLTGAVQIAIDFFSEVDAMRKFCLGSRLTPYLIALSANSSIKEGQVLSLVSDRAAIWTETDDQRSGVPDFVFGELSTFDDYINWALDKPSYFLKRDGKQIALPDCSFRDLLHQTKPLSELKGDFSLTAKDWELHLSTLFPWVRLRHYLEFRQFDMNPLPMQLALAALVRGLFDDNESLKIVESLSLPATRSEFNRLVYLSYSEGVNNTEIRKICIALVEAAEQSLLRAGAREEHFITPLKKRLENLLELPRADNLNAFLSTQLLR